MKQRALMREATESLFAVVSAHAAGTEPAKGQLLGQIMRADIIHCDGAAVGARKDLALLSPVAPKIIKRERARRRIDSHNGLVQEAIAKHWQYRAEDLLVQSMRMAGVAPRIRVGTHERGLTLVCAGLSANRMRRAP